MSLDVYLEGEPQIELCTCSHCGDEHEISKTPEYFSANITHNLTGMARAAGIYEACWRPEELGIVKACQLISILREGVARLGEDPERFKEYDAQNGWGTYEQFVPWLREYLKACTTWPEANVRVSR